MESSNNNRILTMNSELLIRSVLDNIKQLLVCNLLKSRMLLEILSLAKNGDKNEFTITKFLIVFVLGNDFFKW